MIDNPFSTLDFRSSILHFLYRSNPLVCIFPSSAGKEPPIAHVIRQQPASLSTHPDIVTVLQDTWFDSTPLIV